MRMTLSGELKTHLKLDLLGAIQMQMTNAEIVKETEKAARTSLSRKKRLRQKEKTL